MSQPPRDTTEEMTLSVPMAEGSSPMMPKIVRFADLARCGGELWIEHEGQLYRLQKTKQGKLILTK
ncbi:hemin uptake protein HemP [Rubripirellula amarantea]|uniref:Hemin uptake protein hemP n=1 Tax=Rubripirellula amarantea TaxID=2527999 RepID=A0A5C5WJ04_9BACT|nr:hemin uptake protein HemP [Rubripirellula amarantea]MDA8746109.1 hemin uptake protein HemP [Rubripirellula amarantea]TWT50547.1 hypothetical protein Pla22_32900 [Rubripirellula amarantea]